jgi:hypothetical protein
MANTKKTWIAVLIAVFVIAGVAAIGLVAGSAYWISRHVSSQVTSTESAEAEFARDRARFAGQQPIIEITGGGDNPTFRRLSAEAEATGKVELHSLHARVYDPEDGKLVRADVPFWLIQLGKSFRFRDMGSLTVEDLERHGPGLIVNGQGDDGQQFLVWID